MRKPSKTKQEKLRELADHATEIIQSRMEIALYAFYWGMSIKGDRPEDKLEFVEAILYELDFAIRVLKKAEEALKTLANEPLIK